MPRNANKNKLSNYSMDFKDGGSSGRHINCGTDLFTGSTIPSISISAWINTSDAGVIMSKDEVTSGDRVFLFQIAGSLLYWQTTTVSGSSFPDTLTVSSSLVLNGWHHIVVTYNTGSSSDGGEKKIYIDGSEVAAAPNATFNPLYNNANVPINIGRRGDGARYFYDNMSQVCIFDYALDSSQVGYLYNLNNPMNISGGKPTAYWPLGDNSNPNAPGSFPNISVGADSVFEFNNSDQDYINLGTTPIVTGVFTTSMWIKRSSLTPTNVSLFAKDNPSGNRVFHAHFVDASGVIGFWVSPTGSYDSNYRVQTTTSINDLNWHHVVFINKGNNVQNEIWIDGQEASYSTQGTGTSTLYNSSTVNTVIGAHSTLTNRTFNGEIANTQFWNTDLQESDIITLYNNGQPLMTGTQPQEANLKAWYKLNQSANWEADTTGEWQIPDARSAYPQSFRFTESQDYITGDINLARDKVHAVSFWVKNKQVSGLGYVVTNRVSSYGPGFSFIINQSGSNNGYIFSNVATSPTTTQSVATNYISQLRIPNDDQWHHVAWTQDTVTYKLKAYIDGVFVYEQLPTARTDSNNIADLKISSDVSTQDFGGFVSNVMVWEDVVLTDGNVPLNDVALGEIAELYNGGIPITSASVQPDKLKAWCKLDGSEFYMNLGIGTGFKNTWSIENQALPVNYNSALYFSGGIGNEHLETPSAPALLMAGDHSFSFWINYDTYQADSTSYFFDKGTLDYALGLTGNTLRLIYYNYYDSGGPSGNNTIISIDTNWKPTWEDGWHHVLVAVDQTTLTVTLYMDGGEDIITKSLPADYVSPDQSGGVLNIMSYTGTSLSTAGFLSNLAFYNGTVLTLSDAETLYNNGTPEDNISFSPTSWWKIDNTSTGLVDNVGTSNLTNTGAIQKNIPVSTHNLTSINQTDDNLVNNNVSTLNGESSGMDINNLVQSDLTRKVPFSSYSYNLDGGTEYWDGTASLGDYIGDNYTGYLSVSLWFYPRDTAGDGGLFQLRPVGGGSTYLELSIYLESNFLYLNARANNDDVAFGTANNNTWNHLLGVFHPTGVKLYLNGEETALSFTYSSTGLDLLNHEVWIGQYFSTSYPFDGNIMHCAVWNEQLLEADASKLYNNGVPQDLRDFRVTPLRWWALDENYSYWNGTRMIGRELMAGDDVQGINIDQIDLEGNAPAIQASGVGSNFIIGYLEGNMSSSDKNAYSINMADYGNPGGNPPADSGRTVDVP